MTTTSPISQFVIDFIRALRFDENRYASIYCEIYGDKNVRLSAKNSTEGFFWNGGDKVWTPFTGTSKLTTSILTCLENYFKDQISILEKIMSCGVESRNCVVSCIKLLKKAMEQLSNWKTLANIFKLVAPRLVRVNPEEIQYKTTPTPKKIISTDPLTLFIHEQCVAEKRTLNKATGRFRTTSYPSGEFEADYLEAFPSACVKNLKGEMQKKGFEYSRNTKGQYSFIGIRPKTRKTQDHCLHRMEEDEGRQKSPNQDYQQDDIHEFEEIDKTDDIDKTGQFSVAPQMSTVSSTPQKAENTTFFDGQSLDALPPRKRKHGA